MMHIRTKRLPFVESKAPNLEYVDELFDRCRAVNLWANRGPLYGLLREKYEGHMNLADSQAITPCSNGGVGLEVIAKYLEIKEEKSLRWAASSFSFENLGRGFFNEIEIVDCTAEGMLDLDLVRQLEPSSFDGILVTNVFGAWPDFSPYIDYARQSGKLMIIDNAAGISENIPDWPYQSFSLHHTKPYGAGEGGLVLSPADEAEPIYNLINYGKISREEKRHWLNNGKISDISCAFLIDRLDQFSDWRPKYEVQTGRVTDIAAKAGLKPLFSPNPSVPYTSLPFVSEKPILQTDIDAAVHLTMTKYYLPLAETPVCQDIYRRLVNIPCHPDVANLTEAELLEDFRRLTA